MFVITCFLWLGIWVSPDVFVQFFVHSLKVSRSILPLGELSIIVFWGFRLKVLHIVLYVTSIDVVTMDASII